MEPQKILVTGSSGLIGTAVCAVLLSRGKHVRRFDVADQRGGFGSILSPTDLKSAMKDCIGVIHLAAVSRVIWGEHDPHRCHETNVGGTRNIIDCIFASNPKPWLIFGSSREVYGQCASQPVIEDTPLRPMNHYARSKVEAEQAIERGRDAGLRASVLRFSTVYGAITDHADRVIPQFCRAALADRRIRVEGATNTLDITHVADVADCIANVANALSQGSSFEPMHLTTGRATSLQSLAQTVVRLVRSKSEIIVKEPRNFDVHSFVGDPQLAKMRIGWQPKTPLETGIEKLISQFLESGSGDWRKDKGLPCWIEPLIN
ncbi:NAD-dependent epimerase/dehydratase family protein [Litoreibacter arenae]|uniref:NAD-dependent epimerase/dehydratase family protein n=1 Tax=Litoreibacter arenae TaxID=491388 RepID=UPI0014703B70|nr:NAD(P)-dependent oxidoreductase [Litoreibacter arenae]